jgi:hypothetical protein
MSQNLLLLFIKRGGSHSERPTTIQNKVRRRLSRLDSSGPDVSGQRCALAFGSRGVRGGSCRGGHPLIRSRASDTCGTHRVWREVWIPARSGHIDPLTVQTQRRALNAMQGKCLQLMSSGQAAISTHDSMPGNSGTKPSHDGTYRACPTTAK